MNLFSSCKCRYIRTPVGTVATCIATTVLCHNWCGNTTRSEQKFKCSYALYVCRHAIEANCNMVAIMLATYVPLLNKK